MVLGNSGIIVGIETGDASRCVWIFGALVPVVSALFEGALIGTPATWVAEAVD